MKNEKEKQWGMLGVLNKRFIDSLRSQQNSDIHNTQKTWSRKIYNSSYKDKSDVERDLILEHINM